MDPLLFNHISTLTKTNCIKILEADLPNWGLHSTHDVHIGLLVFAKCEYGNMSRFTKYVDNIAKLLQNIKRTTITSGILVTKANPSVHEIGLSSLNGDLVLSCDI